MITIVLIGPPGVGKGTQAEILSRTYEIPHLSAGGMLRHEIAKNTEIGRIADDHIRRSVFVPSQLVCSLLDKRIRKNDCRDIGFILEGYPRNVEMAVDLDKLFESHNITPACYFMLEAGYDILRERIRKRFENDKRVDDSPEILEARLKAYDRETRPLRDYYKDIACMDCERDKEEISREIQDMVVGKLEQSAWLDEGNGK